MNWRRAALVTLEAAKHPPLRHQPLWSDEWMTAKAWREYALCLIAPRHFPEYFDDADIEKMMRHLWSKYHFPWEIVP
jgi:hypothetical protein